MSKLIVGNWKMNGTLSLVDAFLDSINEENIVIGFPDLFISYAHFRNKKLKIAAQDSSIYDEFGAHTGEISAKMLFESGCEYVILGHSERRSSSQSDSVENILKKLKNVIHNEMTAIFCVDENYEQLINEETCDFLKNNLEKIIIAYEPLSAIGTGVVSSISEISSALKSIKEKYFNIRTLYGGSVNSKNANDILSINEVDGVLIGGASLKLNELKEIVKFS